MDNIIRLTEGDLHNMIKTALNEVMGWTLEKDDVEWVNTPEDGETPYGVKLWQGSGYQIQPFGVYASDEDEALNAVVAYCEKNGYTHLFADDDAQSLSDDLEKDGIYFDDAEAIMDEHFLYVDATMEGAQEPHYIYAENLSIQPMPEHFIPSTEDIENGEENTPELEF